MKSMWIVQLKWFSFVDFEMEIFIIEMVEIRKNLGKSFKSKDFLNKSFFNCKREFKIQEIVEFHFSFVSNFKY